jgi:hypothetical protein
MKFQIFISELQNYTVNVEGHNLHQMPLQRVPGNWKNKSNDYVNIAKVYFLKTIYTKSVHWKKKLQKKLLNCTMRLAHF